MPLIAQMPWQPRDEDGVWHVFEPGDEITGFEDRHDWLLRNGIAVDSDAQPTEADTPVEAEEAEETEDVEEVAEETEPEPEPETPAEPEAKPVKRPAKTAKIDAWQDYIRAMGHNPGKKTKNELVEMANNL